MVERKVGSGVIRLVRGDITDIEVEAFVFDITEDCKLGSGYGGAIAQRGGKAVQQALDKIGRLPTGHATMTSAGKMKAKHIIHANGPKHFEPDTERKLRQTIDAALDVAKNNGIKQLAVPPIGTGLYQIPLDVSARILVEAVTEHLAGETSLTEVAFVALDTREQKPLQATIEKGA